ncbi:hypothetical protein GUJ93_ZPchr0008g12257 [Zizania palustris]|uniref:Uncharacterized protein n=1 Tax=Zizania palustris TaxID=103762 RepID=A0A8J5V1X6_ZIZPA|nr:hypothetical protein GUJ93_ZPchr0008g12257 [Zizania palustris]
MLLTLSLSDLSTCLYPFPTSPLLAAATAAAACHGHGDSSSRKREAPVLVAFRHHGLACSLGDSSCFLYGWVPQLRYFCLGVVGVGAVGHPHGHSHTNHHELELELFFPKFMESSASEAAAAVTGLATPQDTRAMYEEFDELLQNFLDAKEEQIAGFDPSCFLREDIPDMTSLLGDDAGDDILAVNSLAPMGPILPVNNVAQPQAEQQQQNPSSASSHCNVGPQISDTSPVRANNNCSFKRSATPGGIIIYVPILPVHVML